MSHAIGQDGYEEFEDENKIEFEDIDDIKLNPQMYVLRSEINKLKDVLMEEIKKNQKLETSIDILTKRCSDLLDLNEMLFKTIIDYIETKIL